MNGARYGAAQYDAAAPYRSNQTVRRPVGALGFWVRQRREKPPTNQLAVAEKYHVDERARLARETIRLEEEVAELRLSLAETSKKANLEICRGSRAECGR